MTKELTVPKASDFAIVADPTAKDLMNLAVQDLGVGSFQLQRLKVPGSGGLAWEVPSVSGSEIATSVDVIIVGMKGNQRAWYRQSFSDSGGGTSPDCYSTDGVVGNGNRDLVDDSDSGEDETGDRESNTYECASCPWNQYGSARNGSGGRDCGESIYLYFFTKDSRLPMLMVVPTMSLRSVKDYVLKLVSFGRHFSSVVTRLTLENDTNARGIKFSRLVLSHVADLDEQERAGIASLAQDFKESVINKVNAGNVGD